ncbi:MAG: ROK family transcriptional regulator [Clostridiales bacterium]|nr:ROK family transcriptional regulator [Clostridiales bacterium]
MKTKTRNSSYTKQYNRKLILSIIQRQAVSRADVARKTGLTRAAVSIIVDELITEGIVVVKGTQETSTGRKPVLLDINPESHYAIGLNIARDHCSIGIVNIKGEILSATDIDISKVKSIHDAIGTISNKINTLCTQTKIEQDKILGMGISTPGPLDAIHGIIMNPPNFELWNNVAIVSEFKKTYSFEIILHNNSSALALAEKNYGAGREYADFILLVVDAGVGSGIIIDNKLYRGFHGFGSEIGHTSINFEGSRCNCGNYGCLEVYASIPAILKEAALIDTSLDSWNRIVDCANEGNTFCIDLIDKEARYIAAGLVNVVNLLHIETIILTGYITYKPTILKDCVEKYIGQQAIIRDLHEIEILLAGITEHSEIIAAATIIFDSLIYNVHPA